MIAVTYLGQPVKGLEFVNQPRTKHFSFATLGIIGQDDFVNAHRVTLAGKDQVLTIPPQREDTVLKITAKGVHKIELEGIFGIVELDLEGQIKVDVVTATFKKIRILNSEGASLQISGQLIWNDVVEVVAD